MSELTLPGPGGALPAYLSEPSGAGPWPGVVVVHDALGLGQDIRNQADWLAAAGYLAVVPDLFAARGRSVCMVQTFRNARERRGGAYADLAATRDWMVAEPRCTGRIGIIGYCLGGGLALLMAPGQGFDASSVNYGGAARWAYGADSSAQPALLLAGAGLRIRPCAERRGSLRPPLRRSVSLTT